MKTKLFILSLIALLTACGHFPRDVENTLENSRNNLLMVGLARTDNENGNDPRGPVAGMVKAYAKHLNAKLKWVPGLQSEIIELLKNRQIQIAIGGFTEKSLYKKEVALTRPCFTEKIKLGAMDSTHIPASPEGLSVNVSNLMTAIYVKEKHARPVWEDSGRQHGQFFAGTEDELRAAKMYISDVTFHETGYVMAVPKGENAFLIDLEKFIANYDAARQ